MHRIRYTKLTEAQIAAKLAVVAGPTSASPLEDVFAGTTLRIVTDGGPALDYRFASADRLSVAENGGPAVQAGYGALTLGPLALLSHLVPGTQRGYHVIVDRDTGLATVFEVWFSGYEDNREVQREIHFGYVDRPGREPPTARHAITNRLEGKGYYWKQDTGVETIEYYPSVLYSNFVELTRFGGELSFCGPSDYVKIDDERYVYARVEAEFSGTMTLYALDANRIEQVGVRLGFDAQDDLEYYLFRGRGEWLGQLAHFEPFGDVGTSIPLGDRVVPQVKGGRPVYRPLKTNPIMTRPEVDAAVARNKTVFAERNPMAGNKLPISDFLVGKALTLRYDNGQAFEYRFDGMQQLRWRRQGESAWHEERYESWESAPGVIMFGHLLSGARDHDAFSIVADFDEALVTCLHGTMGTPYMANEAAVETWFGVIEMEGITPPPKYRRHRFTDELVGRAITWNYSPGLTSMHLYSTPHSLSWIIFLENGAGGLEWSGPASYVKIRDQLYFAYWLEEACNGTLGTILINMRTMHDCGVGYHCGTDGLRLSAVGAHARHAGRFDVLKYFGPRGA
ncbi:MAG TPA: MoaF N-terminal domain-containing protein [Gammaproteobacteria bacterium]